jgi:hypothetical protein
LVEIGFCNAQSGPIYQRHLSPSNKGFLWIKLKAIGKKNDALKTNRNHLQTEILIWFALDPGKKESACPRLPTLSLH